MLKYSQAIPIKFIGVWDTVGALGVPFGNIPGFGKSDMQFLNTGLRTSNKFAYHALAIDEHRKAFAPTLWTKDTFKIPDPDAAPPRTLDQTEQRWFVGAHANVGGGCQSDLLAQVPLKWMMEKAILHGLAFRRAVEVDGHFGSAPVSDSYSEFMNGAYKLATLGRRFHREIGEAPIDNGPSITTTINETIDASVFDYWRQNKGYRPPNLAKWEVKHGLNLDELTKAVFADDPKQAAA